MKKFLLGSILALSIGCAPHASPVNGIGPSSASPQPIQSLVPAPQQNNNPVSVGPSEQPVVIAQDATVHVTDVKVGDERLETAVQFTVQSTHENPEVTLKVDTFGKPLQLFRVRNDQYGQTEFVQSLAVDQNAKQVSLTLPGAGSFLVAGAEKPLSFANTPYVDALQTRQYRIQNTQPSCGSTPNHIIVDVGGYPAEVWAWTYDTTFPVKSDVYIHPGMGSDEKPSEYSFARWKEYNTSQSPDKDRLAAEINSYTVDGWNTRLAPDAAVGAYLQRRRGCGDPGRPWLDVCHSAGCNKALIATLDSWPQDFWNDLGIIAVAPAFGGSHIAIKELVDATIAQQHMPLLMSTLSHLIRQDGGFLLANPNGRLLVDILKGTSSTLLNECARSLAWDGRGTGIPTEVYSWFSIWDISFPFLKKRVTPNNRFTMLAGNRFTDYAPNKYTDPQTNAQSFNYIEALREYWKQRSKYPGLNLDGSIDVIAGYMNGDLGTQSKKFLDRFGKDAIIDTLWRHKDLELDTEFQGEALPWQNTLIAKSPSLKHGDPNDNHPNDAYLTLCEQLACEDGSSILAPDSKYGALKINQDALHSRVPKQIRKFQTVENLNHAEAVKGRPEVWDLMNRWLLERVAKVHEEEQNLILTDEEKKKIQGILIPEGGEAHGVPIMDFDLPDGTHRFIRDFTFYGLGSIQFTQDPLKTGQKNRVRMAGSGTLGVMNYSWSENISKYIMGRYESGSWTINHDFICRGGVWHLVMTK